VVVAEGEEGGSGFGAGARELLQELGGRGGEIRRSSGLADVGFGGDDGGAARRQLGDVRGETAEGHGFFVRLPGKAGFGHALEDAAGAGHFFVKFEQEKLGDGHGCKRMLSIRRWRG
jgi:hypothetical protein